MSQGDSGSPLWLSAADGKPELVGVLHGGHLCDKSLAKVVYVDILHEDVRIFLSKYVDMTGMDITSVPKPKSELDLHMEQLASFIAERDQQA